MFLPDRLHSWGLDPKAAGILQRALGPLVQTRPYHGPAGLAAGADAAYLPETDLAVGAAVIWDIEERKVAAKAGVLARVTFPYRSGLLSFREAPVLLAALGQLEIKPHVYIFDGQGQAHQLGLGLAAHAGLWLQAPTVGCAKSRLVGTFEPVGPKPGDYSPLMNKGVEVGAVVRTRAGVKPVFVSPGHLMDTPGAMRLVLAACAGYRQPEPLRLAHLMANRWRARIRDLSIQGLPGQGFIAEDLKNFIQTHDLEDPDQAVLGRRVQNQDHPASLGDQSGRLD